jgi:hypothetical protein
MAATVDSRVPLLTGTQFEVHKVVLSSLVSDQLENVAHGGPSGANASFVLPIVITSATSNDPVTVEWISGSDSTSNNTIAIKAKVAAGGDISGAKVALIIFFGDRASDGLNSP